MTTQELLEEIKRQLYDDPYLADREVLVVRKKETKDHRCKYKMYRLTPGNPVSLFRTADKQVLVLNCS